VCGPTSEGGSEDFFYFPSIDHFPSFILIASPSVIGTTLTLKKTDSAGNLKVPLEIKNFS